jgi:hypothetical protein
MIELNAIEQILMLLLFGIALWFTWNRASLHGYHEGYNDACADVALGNITVKLVEPEE